MHAVSHIHAYLNVCIMRVHSHNRELKSLTGAVMLSNLHFY